MTGQVQARPLGNLVAAIATVACCDIAMGLTLQLLPLLMAGPLLPMVIGGLGSRRVVLVVVGVIITCLALFAATSSLWLWFPLRLLFGIFTGTLFTVSESWVLTFATDENRGRIMSLYVSVLAVTFSVGPLILPFTGMDGWLPWLIGMGCVSLSILPLAFVRVSDDAFKVEEKGGFLRVVRRAPMLLVAMGAATLFDNVLISFFTIFAQRSGLELDVASRVLGLAIIGNTLLFYPMGLLADRWSRLGVIVITAILTVVASLALIPLVATWAVWPLMILLTASAFGVYVVGLAVVGDSFKGSDVVAGSAAVAAMWGVGGLIGPPVAGAAIDAFGTNAMPATLAFFYLVMLSGLAITGGRLVRETPDG
jgi:MFS family permease